MKKGDVFGPWQCIINIPRLRNLRNKWALLLVPLKSGKLKRQSWIQHGRLCAKSTVAKTGNKVDYCRIGPYVFNFVAGFGNKSATTWIRQLVAVDFVADTFNFVADTVDFVADTVDFVGSVCTGPKRHGRLVDFQQSRPCWIKLCRQCAPGLNVCAFCPL